MRFFFTPRRMAAKSFSASGAGFPMRLTGRAGLPSRDEVVLVEVLEAQARELRPKAGSRNAFAALDVSFWR